jgi:hypothetical protein
MPTLNVTKKKKFYTSDLRLRMTGIPYEPVYSSKSSKKGQIPYIELNGQHIPVTML